MIGALETLDEKTALGILARAALALEDQGNPAAKALLDSEETIRSSILREARRNLGIQADDYSPETIERLSDYLDQESDRLTGVLDADAALKRLAARGELPSDLYKISIIEHIADFHRAGFAREKQLIESTIRLPTKEQHFGVEAHRDEPSLISLFARQFKTRFPYKDFTMLVAAAREGLILHVHQACRIYPSILDGLDIRKVENLVDLLRCFADSYGFDVEIDGKRSHFFLLLDKPAPPHIRVNIGGKTKSITVSQFLQKDRHTGCQIAALVVAIDLQEYKKTLNKMNVKLSDIFNL
jgi:hypothetical protein